MLAAFSSPLNRAIEMVPQVAQTLSPLTPHGAALLNQMVNYQSQVIACDDDYLLMAMLSALVWPLLVFMRK